ncbi:MAG: hypothetical protein ACRDZ8_00120 [Acidimicrobiales bacterium]
MRPAPETAIPVRRQARWRETLPRLATDVGGLGEAVTLAGLDLGALRIFNPDHPHDAVVAAGAPWFLALFGRDSLITPWMTLVLDPHLALSTAHPWPGSKGGRPTRPPVSSRADPPRSPARRPVGVALDEQGDIYYGTAGSVWPHPSAAHAVRQWARSRASRAA